MKTDFRSGSPSSGGARVLMLLLAAAGATAAPSAGRAQPEATTATIEELERRGTERDAVILQLLNRIEMLERRLAAASSPEVAAAPAPSPPLPATSEAVAESEPPAGPALFEVDEDAVTRALEQALVLEGAQLLPPGTVQVQPSLSYARQEQATPIFIPSNDGVLPGETRIERDVLETALTVRAGLPFDAQAELTVPYRFDDNTRVTRANLSPIGETNSSGSGFGDLRVGLTKALVREEGWMPSLFAGVDWDTDTGSTEDGVPLGTGFNEIELSLTAVKSQDPLVFIGGLSYEHAFEDDGVRPGDQYGITIGTALAASPETSLRFELSQVFQEETKVGGRRIDGSDRTAATLSIGASSVLSRRAFLDVTAGVGLTEDAPAYVIGVSLPIRFQLPLP